VQQEAPAGGPESAAAEAAPAEAPAAVEAPEAAAEPAPAEAPAPAEPEAEAVDAVLEEDAGGAPPVAAEPRPAVQESLRVTPGVCQVCRSTSKVVLVEQQTISGTVTIPGTYLCQNCIDEQPNSTDWKVWVQWRMRKGGA
jgi:nucleoid-associated protein YgaU